MASEVIRLICPNLKCRAILTAPAAARGKAVRCRQCGMKVRVPEPLGTPKPGSPAAASSNMVE
jgi:hypothetical protein